jgi:hypothetical protein
MGKLRVVAITFVPENDKGRVRPVGRVLPGDKQSWQYFDAIDPGTIVERSHSQKPTGRQLWVDHERFIARAVISRSMLVDPGQAGDPPLEQLFILTPETPEHEVAVTTAAYEVGKYDVRLWNAE